MAVALFTAEERMVGRALAAIPYANPFTDDRAAFEKTVLGADYREPERFLLPGQPLHQLEGNLGALMARAEVLLRAVAARLPRRSGALNESDLKSFEGLVHFVVFHRHASSFDGLIGSHAVGGGLVVDGQSRSRVSVPALFDRVRRDLEELLVPAGVGADLTLRAPEWFGFYFQIRRAWVHTYAFIHGGSRVLRALRARIWQSVFTHDMRRYQRGVHQRMGDITTLITGPSGSGKELVARAIGLSRFVPFDPRARDFAADFSTSLHPLNLSALSPTLIESELFGHRRGAFTGALGDRAGFFETCGEHGTVFLDEIGETAPEIQVKLLRVLQTRQFNRLGDTAQQSFRGRIVAATNRDLPEGIRAGRFREDFFFRLCADRVETPSLRDVLGDDPEELLCLTAHVCASLAGAAEGPVLAEEVLTTIRKRLGNDYAWPGNFRELEQCVRNVLVHGDYLPAVGARESERDSGDWHDAARGSRLTMDALLQHYCAQVVADAGSLEEAARRLAVDRRTVRRYAKAADSKD